jgi:hypothetical protein
MARFCAEVRPLTDAGRFLTGPDMGTAEEDFEPLRRGRAAPAAIRAMVAGVPFEDLLTGYGVAVAAETALGGRAKGSKGSKGSKGLNGHTVAIEGFGKVGGGVAREVGRRGGRVTAVSTVAGCVSDPSGLDVDRLLTLRRTHGDACVLRYGRPVLAPHQLFTEVNADVLVPGTRPGAIDAQTAVSLPPGVRVIAPAANAPYTAAGAEVLRQRGIVALPGRQRVRPAQFDLGQATMAMLLAAADLGIGSCHAGVADLALARPSITSQNGPSRVTRPFLSDPLVDHEARRGAGRHRTGFHWSWANSSRTAAVSGWPEPRTRVRSAITWRYSASASARRPWRAASRASTAREVRVSG